MPEKGRDKKHQPKTGIPELQRSLFKFMKPAATFRHIQCQCLPFYGHKLFAVNTFAHKGETMQKVLVLKCAIIFLIAFILLIPLSMISDKIKERRSFQWQAREAIAQSWTGEQTLITPFLIIPYATEVTRYAGKDKDGNPIEKTSQVWHKDYVVPDELAIDTQVDTELRKQGIYGIPVYSSRINFDGQFGAETISAALERQRQTPGFVKFGEAYLALNLADIRGIDNSPRLLWQDQEIEFESNSGIETLASGIHAKLTNLSGNSPSRFQFSLSVRGMDSLQIVPATKQFNLSVNSTWPHPQFTGAFLPQTREISDQGFSAQWQVNHFSTGIEQLIDKCERQECMDLYKIAFGVNFIQAVDGYLQSERSLKYGILFIGLSFIAFFVFETLHSIAIHPVQYTLVGFALALFFLLLSSLSEHVSFALAYILATSACVSLLAYYLRFVLGAWLQASIFTASLAALYGLLFVIVGAEDFALLMGSILIFAVLAGIMIVTRNIDWYSLRNGASQN